MNPLDLMKNLQKMQQEMASFQGKLKDLRAAGTAGGDMVAVVVNGQMEVEKVSIDPEAFKPEEIGFLEELIKAATNAAVAKMRDVIKEEMGKQAGGMNLGSLFPGAGV